MGITHTERELLRSRELFRLCVFSTRMLVVMPRHRGIRLNPDLYRMNVPIVLTGVRARGRAVVAP